MEHDYTWTVFSYIISTRSGERRLTLHSHFHEKKDGVRDTTTYTVKENDAVLGDLLIRDDGRIGWTGRTSEFDEEELDELADRIAIRIDPSSEIVYSGTPVRNNGDFLVYSDEPSETDRSSVLGIRAGEEQIIATVSPIPGGWKIGLGSGAGAELTADQHGGWNARTSMNDDLLDFIVDYLTFHDRF